MVNQKNILNKYAFTMIELIFAIVIISIAVISLPMMTQVTSRGAENNIVQEAIFAASAELMGASSGYWDKNSMDDGAFSNMSRVIDIGGDCNNTITSDRYRLRPGHIAQPLHRRCVISSSGNVNNSSDTTFPNLNNAVLGTQQIFMTPNPEASGYKDSYTSNVTITQTGNIKFINIDVSNTETPPKIIVVLKMQSANIGEIDYFKRRFL